MSKSGFIAVVEKVRLADLHPPVSLRSLKVFSLVSSLELRSLLYCMLLGHPARFHYP